MSSATTPSPLTRELSDSLTDALLDCKPWRDCSSNEERLDGENGLLLTPSIDQLFDRGFISFENDGRLLISRVAHQESLRRMGVPVGAAHNVGGFSEGQRRYLEYHRDSVFLAANIKR